MTTPTDTAPVYVRLTVVRDTISLHIKVCTEHHDLSYSPRKFYLPRPPSSGESVVLFLQPTVRDIRKACSVLGIAKYRGCQERLFREVIREFGALIHDNPYQAHRLAAATVNFSRAFQKALA